MRGTGDTLARRLREKRVAKELTQDQLGSAAGVTGSAIKEIEAGRSKGSPALHRIARALGTTPEWLTGERGAKETLDDEVMAPEALDAPFMAYLITELEAGLQEADQQLPPAVHAKVLLDLYSGYVGTGERPSRAVILQFAKRTAA